MVRCLLFDAYCILLVSRLLFAVCCLVLLSSLLFVRCLLLRWCDVCCLLLSVCSCWFFLVCCSLSVVCGGRWRSSTVARCLLFVVRCLLFVGVGCLLFCVICSLLPAV